MRLSIRILFAFAIAVLSGASTQAKEFTSKDPEVRAFRQADADGDEVLSKPEFKTFVQLMADVGQATAKRIRFWGAYGIAFSIADQNGDGTLTPSEMLSADKKHGKN